MSGDSRSDPLRGNANGPWGGGTSGQRAPRPAHRHAANSAASRAAHGLLLEETVDFLAVLG
jgi:hypothetical protein